MCIICLEIEKGKMTPRELRRAMMEVEMSDVHMIEVSDAIDRLTPPVDLPHVMVDGEKEELDNWKIDDDAWRRDGGSSGV